MQFAAIQEPCGGLDARRRLQNQIFDPAGLTASEVLAPHVGILDHPRAKELLVAPRGVRLIWLADEAERGDYILLRQARFGLERFDAECLADLLRRCAEVRRALAEAASPRELAREAAE